MMLKDAIIDAFLRPHLETTRKKKKKKLSAQARRQRAAAQFLYGMQRAAPLPLMKNAGIIFSMFILSTVGSPITGWEAYDSTTAYLGQLLHALVAVDCSVQRYTRTAVIYTPSYPRRQKENSTNENISRSREGHPPRHVSCGWHWQLGKDKSNSRVYFLFRPVRAAYS
jgi:hypothetical protein